MSLDPKDYFVKQISHLSKGVVKVASALCQLKYITFALVILLGESFNIYRIYATIR